MKNIFGFLHFIYSAQKPLKGFCSYFFQFSLASFIFILSRMLIGKISDYLGRKRIASFGLLFSSLATFSYTLAISFFHFAFAKSLKELGNTLTKSVYDAMQADAFPKKVRKLYLRKLGAVFPFSRAIGALIGFAISLYFSFVAGFYAASLLYLFSCIAFLLFYREKAGRKSLIKKQGIKFFYFRFYSKQFAIASFLAFLGMFCFTLAYYPAFFLLLKELNITTSEIFLILLVLYIFSSFNKPILILSILMLGTSYYIWRIGFKVFLYNSTSPRARGEQLGLVKTLEGIAGILGPLASGVIVEFFSFRIVFLIAAIFYVFGALLLKIFKF